MSFSGGGQETYNAFALELCLKERIKLSYLIHLFISPIHLLIVQYLFTAIPEADERVSELVVPCIVQIHSIQSTNLESH